MEKVVLDACILYPYTKRDALLSIAAEGVYQPLWSDEIHDEWSRNLRKNNPTVTKEKTDKTVQKMNDVFPQATITGHHHLIPALTLPDDGDRHVLALAIHTNSKLIVTENLKHFPSTILNPLNISAISTDTFLNQIYLKYNLLVITAIKTMRARLKNPPKSAEELLTMFKSNGLTNFASSLNSVKQSL